jgi:hypothetical protein
MPILQYLSNGLEGAIDYLQQSEAILRRISSPVADQVAESLQWVMQLENLSSPKNQP